jgi:pimeloyl-ACP methyl ester carboxylesterase
MADGGGPMLTTGELADLFRITPKRAREWARLYPKQLTPVRKTPHGALLWPRDKALAALATGLHEEDD